MTALQSRLGLSRGRVILCIAPEFFQCLWNLPTATTPVSLSGIYWLTTLLSALIQYAMPKIHPPTHRSSPRSSTSYGLQWQIALHAKAMATAWDLITQTHLALWGCVMDGIPAEL